MTLLHERNKDGMDGKIVVDVVERRGEDHHAAFALGMDNEEWRSVIETQENGRGTRSYGRSAKEANTIPAGSRAQDRVCGVDLRDRGKAGVARCSAGVMPEQKKCASAALHVLIYGGFEAGGKLRIAEDNESKPAQVGVGGLAISLLVEGESGLVDGRESVLEEESAARVGRGHAGTMPERGRSARPRSRSDRPEETRRWS